MAALLYRLGRLAFRRRLVVALLWVAVLAGAGVAATRAPAAPPDNNSVPGTESQQANDLLQKSFPASNPNGAIAQIVFVAPHGQKLTSARDRAIIGQMVHEAAATPQAVGAVSPFAANEVSRDGSAAIATITYKVAPANLTSVTTNTLQNAARQGRDAGLTVQIGGTALSNPLSGTSTVAVGLAIAAVVLLLTFGSLTAAGLPLLTAGTGVGISVATIIALGSALGLSSTTRTLALMLGLAVGIDYALFIVSRYREERARDLAPQEAAARAVGTAGTAVAFAGLTVIIALVGLSLVGIPMLTKMGLSAAGAVAVAVMVAVTLIPALLSFFPRAVLPRAARRRPPRAGRRLLQPTPAASGRTPDPGRTANLGSRWAAFVLRRPVTVLVLAVVALAVIALPATHLYLGNAGNATLPTSSTQRQAYDDISAAFGPGYNGPLTIVVTTGGVRDPQAAATKVASRIGAIPGVVLVTQPQFDQARTVARFTAIPVTAPDASQTSTLVHTIRSERPGIATAAGASYLVTGATAVNIDTAQKVSSALIPYLAAVVGLAFVLLLMVFRSLLVPLKATLGFVLSLLAALGALVAVFQWGWLDTLLGIAGTGPILDVMPIFMIGIAFGLAMDYEFFLVSRIREAYVHGQPPRPSIVSGFRHSGRVVVAAAAIMTSVFAGFIGSGQSVIQMIGFGMAAAVLFDAFVVRLTIVPAVLGLLGDRAWRLPRRLEAALPHLDIEGTALEHRAAPAAVHAARSAVLDKPAGNEHVPVR